jgi:hypothetical protein
MPPAKKDKMEEDFTAKVDAAIPEQTAIAQVTFLANKSYICSPVDSLKP